MRVTLFAFTFGGKINFVFSGRQSAYTCKKQFLTVKFGFTFLLQIKGIRSCLNFKSVCFYIFVEICHTARFFLRLLENITEKPTIFRYELKCGLVEMSLNVKSSSIMSIKIVE